jgi:hypothetical protein
MGFDVKDRVKTELLDDFDGDSIAAGYCQGEISADQSGTGKLVHTTQLMVLWQPRGINLETEEPYKVQVEWYSMGQKPYELGGEEYDLEMGAEKTKHCYRTVTDGPKLNISSKMGKLCDRLDELKRPVSGADAAIFVGIPAHLMREPWESGDKEGKGRKFKSGQEPKDFLMPTKLIEPLAKGAAPVSTKAAVAAQAASTEDDDDAKDMIKGLMDGKIEADIAEAVIKNPRIKAMGLKSKKIFDLLDSMVANGTMKLDAKTKRYTVA